MPMIVFPAAAALLALLCAVIVGWDAMRGPRPERAIWTIAFVVFAVAAGSEVVGAVAGWSPALARVYYLSGAVLVVGLLALGELYLLFPRRLPSFTPGIALLVVAVAVTAVWGAPVDVASLADRGWDAIERGPFLIALAASINAGGTLVLVGGALWSAWKLRVTGGSGRRAVGCLLIAVGAIAVALGGTLTRFGHREYLYIAMAFGIAIIFGGVLLTRSPGTTRRQHGESQPSAPSADNHRARLISLPVRQEAPAARGAGARYVANHLLLLDDEALSATCRRWSATPIEGDALTRLQARQVWALRLALPESAHSRFDALPLTIQAQLAELYADVWSREVREGPGERRA